MGDHEALDSDLVLSRENGHVHSRANKLAWRNYDICLCIEKTFLLNSFTAQLLLIEFISLSQCSSEVCAG